MKCGRCQGMMIQGVYYHEGSTFIGLRCLMCGNIVDAEIVKNRAESLGEKIPEKKPVRSRRLLAG